MTWMRRTARLALLGAALAALTLAVTMAVPGAQQSGVPRVVRVEPARVTVRAGERFNATLAVAIGADAPGPASMVVDGVGVLQQGFVSRGFSTTLLFCPTFRCVPCPDGTQCFGISEGTVDARTPPGRHAIPIAVTDTLGRVGRATVEVEVTPPLDADADGLPDAWETLYGLDPRVASGDDGPDGDPDRDGVPNRLEMQAWTAPLGVHRVFFAEASSGDRAPGALHCFSAAAPTYQDFGGAWLTLIGDDGRRGISTFGWASSFGDVCALHRQIFAADRVVAAIVESAKPIVVERTSALPTYGVAAPSTRWLFADGGTDGELDTFYLAFNPSADAAIARFTYRLPSGEIALQRERVLAPGHRTTIWVNADDAALGRREASVEVESTAPILLERAWRFDPPGRTVTQAGASPGSAAPSLRWYFGEMDAVSAFDTTLVIANPAARPASITLSLYFADREPVRVSRLQVPAGGRLAFPARRMGALAGDAAAVEVVSTNGVGVVAERRYTGTDTYGPWREATTGGTETGTQWIQAVMYGHSHSVVVVNTSPFPAQVEMDYAVRFQSGESDSARLIEVPAERRVVWVPAKDPRTNTTGTLRIRSLPRHDGRTPQIFVERFYDARDPMRPRLRPAVLPATRVR